jgi:hypothetical protein
MSASTKTDETLHDKLVELFTQGDQRSGDSLASDQGGGPEEKAKPANGRLERFLNLCWLEEADDQDAVVRKTIEAAEVKTLMEFGGMKRVILVTSSFHIPRATMLFDREGIETISYPTHFRSPRDYGEWMGYIPSADGLSGTSMASGNLSGACTTG